MQMPSYSIPLLEAANRHYQAALNEFNRPEEDVVVTSVCGLIKQSIHEHLCIFLNAHGIVTDHDYSVDRLIDFAAEINSGFKNINTACLLCHLETGNWEDKAYCTDFSQVQMCMNELLKIRTLMRIE